MAHELFEGAPGEDIAEKGRAVGNRQRSELVLYGQDPAGMDAGLINLDVEMMPVDGHDLCVIGEYYIWVVFGIHATNLGAIPPRVQSSSWPVILMVAQAFYRLACSPSSQNLS